MSYDWRDAYEFRLGAAALQRLDEQAAARLEQNRQRRQGGRLWPLNLDDFSTPTGREMAEQMNHLTRDMERTRHEMDRDEQVPYDAMAKEIVAAMNGRTAPAPHTEEDDPLTKLQDAISAGRQPSEAEIARMAKALARSVAPSDDYTI